MIKIISTEKNGEPTFTVDLTGDIKHIAAEISYAIAGVFTLRSRSRTRSMRKCFVRRS